MARIAKGAAAEESTWYVPNVEDNREDPEPFMVLLSPLSGTEMRKLEQSMLGKITRNRGEVNFLKRAQDVQERIIKTRVLEVKNYGVQDANTGKVFMPKDGAELLQAVLMSGASESEVIDDIIEALKDMSRLEEGLLGNLSLQSDSSQAETKPLGDGAALNAKAT